MLESKGPQPLLGEGGAAALQGLEDIVALELQNHNLREKGAESTGIARSGDEILVDSSGTERQVPS